MGTSWDRPIKDDLQRVEEMIIETITTQQPLLTEIAMHVVRSGGKRIRPGIGLLSFHAVNGKNVDRVIRLATAFELIHSATLVHDDINDGSDTRRGAIAAYKKYGVQRALITGDFLFVQGFRLGGVMDAVDIVNMVADACTKMAESEILQTEVEHETSAPVETYLKIINGKTAKPMEASARVGAYIGEGSTSQLHALGEFGLNIGYAFQIVDDILDIVGNEADIGKPRGMDILDGKPNLPLMLAMNEGSGDKDFIRTVYKSKTKTSEDIQMAVEIVSKSDALEKAREYAQNFKEKALSNLDVLDPSVYKDALFDLADTVVNRRS